MFNSLIWTSNQRSHTATVRMEYEALHQTVLCSENYKKHVSLLRGKKGSFSDLIARGTYSYDCILKG